MNFTTPLENRKERQNWIRILSGADTSRLILEYKKLAISVPHTTISGPETGLIMVQARADGSGPRFNLGEMSVSKCLLKVDDRYLGYGMVMGSEPEHARLAALFDGLLQHPDFSSQLKRDLIQKLEQEQKEAEKKMTQETGKSRVEFFTMKRGE